MVAARCAAKRAPAKARLPSARAACLARAPLRLTDTSGPAQTSETSQTARGLSAPVGGRALGLRSEGSWLAAELLCAGLEPGVLDRCAGWLGLSPAHAQGAPLASKGPACLSPPLGRVRYVLVSCAEGTGATIQPFPFLSAVFSSSARDAGGRRARYGLAYISKGGWCSRRPRRRLRRAGHLLAAGSGAMADPEQPVLPGSSSGAGASRRPAIACPRPPKRQHMATLAVAHRS